MKQVRPITAIRLAFAHSLSSLSDMCGGGARTRHGSRNMMGNQEEGYGARDTRWDTSHHSILQESRSGRDALLPLHSFHFAPGAARAAGVAAQISHVVLSAYE